MTYGDFAYGSASFGGGTTTITCGTPNCNLIVMDKLIKIYSYEELLYLIDLISDNDVRTK